MTTRGVKAAKKHSRQGADDADGDDDRISALPDAVLQNALGFLPSHDAVRTCVLGRRWRNLWRALPRLRITNVPALGSDKRLDLFVNQLLLLRDPGSTLDECEINISRLGDRPYHRYVDLWVRHALLLRARVMRLCLNGTKTCGLWNRPLISMFLRVLYIDDMCSTILYVMDFSRCPALEDLEITSSVFLAGCKLVSPSAKRLSFVKCTLGANESQFDEERCSISAQSLLSLKIEECKGLAPVIGCMPSLQAASIWIRCAFEDQCEKPCSAGSCCDKEHCLNCDEYIANNLMDGCVLLRGLSNTTSLRFRASFGMFTFKRHLKWCPTFCNLRTFYLVDWCLAGDLGALLSFLEHTPNLEKLTLQVCQRGQCALEAETDSSTERLIELRHLKILEIKCVQIDERVQRTSKLIFSTLVTSNLKQFNIQTI